MDYLNNLYTNRTVRTPMQSYFNKSRAASQLNDILVCIGIYSLDTVGVLGLRPFISVIFGF